MIVVADAAPLITLAGVGAVDLLPRLYGRVLVPDAVAAEVRDRWIGPFPPDWLDVRGDPPAPPAETNRLDAGEVAAIGLVRDLGADLLLIDERKGRLVAGGLGIDYIGTLGVLLLAKLEGHLEEIAPLVLRMRDETSYRITDAVLREALATVGEDPPAASSPPPPAP